MCRRSSSIHEDIDSLTAEISEATGEKICPHCSESVAADAAYCPKCGARLDQETAAGDTGSRAEDGYITVTTNEADAPVDADQVGDACTNNPSVGHRRAVFCPPGRRYICPPAGIN